VNVRRFIGASRRLFLIAADHPARGAFFTSQTVADHLGSTYGKLQITSRAELAAALAPDGG